MFLQDIQQMILWQHDTALKKKKETKKNQTKPSCLGSHAALDYTSGYNMAYSDMDDR